MSDAALDKLLDRLARRFRVTEGREEDLPDAVEVFRQVFGGEREALERRFHHRYVGNPAARSGPSWVLCRDGERAVGLIALLPFDLHVRGRVVPAAWPVDLAVLPDCRQLGPGPLLVRHATRRDAVVLDGNFNKEAGTLAERLGAKEFASAELLRRWLRPGDFMRRFRDGPYETGRAAGAEDFDALWEAAREAYPVAAVRNGDVMRWRYLEHPDRRFTVHTLLRGGELAGYAVTMLVPYRWPARRGILVDLLFADVPEESQRRFLAGVQGQLARRGALCMDALASGSASLALLRRLGYGPRGRAAFLRYPRDHDEFEGATDWHLTYGDADFYL